MNKICTIVILLLVIYSSEAQVAPFIQTQWNQGCYYNASCPVIGGPCGNAYAGCNATLTAQVMKYYSFPSSGIGYHCNAYPIYASNCVDFSTETYNYATMPNTLTSANTNVAALMYDIGVAFDMGWGSASSSSDVSTAILALKTYFKYSPKMYFNYYSSYQNDTMALINKMKAELNAGRPLIIDSENHGYLIDGYNSSNQFHCNFGWGGQYDGYYNITNITNAGDTELAPVYIQFNVRPMQGELECNVGYGVDSLATDTMTFNYSGNTPSTFEFTSTTNWTVTVDSSWILLNMNPNSGGSGFNGNIIVFVNTNIRHDRIGHIYIKSANDEDTIVVIQKGLFGPATNSTNILMSNKSINIKTYPNPTSASVTINVNEQNLPGTISITDMQGRTVRTETMNQSELNVDLGDASNGCYCIQFKNESSSVTEKLVVMH